MNIQTSVFYVGGSKGGVGKSLFSFALVDYLLDRNTNILLVDTDTDNPDVFKAHKDLALPNLLCRLNSLDDADGWADLLLNIFSPMAEAEFARMLRPGGHLVYAVPTARHLFGLKEILYDCPYENEVRQTEYDGFAFVKAVESTAVITLEGQSVQDLFAMTPYYWNTPADGAARLAECESLTTEIGFRFLVYQKV